MSVKLCRPWRGEHTRYSKRTLHNVVRPRATRGLLAGELHLEDARGAVLGIDGRGGAEDADGPRAGLAGVVYLDRAVVLNMEGWLERGWIDRVDLA